MVSWRLGERPVLVFDNGDSEWASEMGLAACCKSEYEDSLSSSLSPSPLRSVKIKCETEACTSEESHDKEKFWMVVERMERDPGGINLLCQMQEVANVVGDLGLLLKDKKGTWQKMMRHPLRAVNPPVQSTTHKQVATSQPLNRH